MGSSPVGRRAFYLLRLIKVNDPVGTAIKLEEYFDVFSNDIAGFFYYFKPFALYIGVVLVVAEVVLGVMLIIGVKLKQTVIAIGLMILFFTFLTFFSAYFNKVTDCGCFGDAIKLTPWESFYKDVILLIMISFLFFYRNELSEETPKWASVTAIVTLILSLGIAYWAIQNLPFIDFRAYKNGVSIPTNMQPSAPLQYKYVMKKKGRKHSPSISIRPRKAMNSWRWFCKIRKHFPKSQILQPGMMRGTSLSFFSQGIK